MRSPPKTFGTGGIHCRVCPSVSEFCESASRKPCEHHISEIQYREFYQILVTDAFGFIDVLIRFRIKT